MARITFFLLLLLGSSTLNAQESASGKDHLLYLKPQFTQIKDKCNYGLVFSGLNLTAGYAFIKSTDTRLIRYRGELAYGKNYNIGFGESQRIKPLDVFYGYRINSLPEHPFIAGPFISVQYLWQFYPDLQSGHMFWFTVMEAGYRLMHDIPLGTRLINIEVSNSLAGFVSRPELSGETTGKENRSFQPVGSVK